MVNRKKRKKAWNVTSFVCFGKERNRRGFESVELSDQELKSSFMCNFLEWNKGGLGVGSMSMSMFDCQLDRL